MVACLVKLTAELPEDYSIAIASAVRPQVLDASKLPEASVKTRVTASAFMQFPFTIACDTACT